MTRPSRLATSAAIAAFGLVGILLAQGIPSRHVRGDPGPKAFPVAAAAVVLVGAAAAFVNDARRVAGDADRSEAGWVTFVAAAATVLYLLVMLVVGFVAATAIYLAGVSRHLDRDRRHRLLVHVAVAMSTAVVLWFVFSRLLGVVLPTGPWGV